MYLCHSPAELMLPASTLLAWAVNIGRFWSAAGVAGKSYDPAHGWRTIAGGGDFISIRCRCWHGRRWWDIVIATDAVEKPIVSIGLRRQNLSVQTNRHPGTSEPPVVRRVNQRQARW